MGKPLYVLLVEDNEHDALLLVRELKRGGFDVTFERVDTPEAMSAALARQAWDLVLSDYSMPRFSAPAALGLVKERGLDLPFIIISGTVGEDVAVESMHAGAHDFMTKGKLGRLIPAIERELRDVTLRAERKKILEQLTISDRMAPMGMLAAGVAHEINNPLACVIANLDSIAERLDKDGTLEGVRDQIRDAREASQRVRDIVADLTIFSRSSEEKTGPVDVERVMESTIRMAWNEIRHRARLVKSYGKTPPVEASESRLAQVFLNLLVNAAQAIGEGNADTNEIRVSTSVAPSGAVVVEVMDTGPGMSVDVQRKLFTPFFTTKPIGVGTGLGLSICHRILDSLGGAIEVMSQEGHGATFRITLPAAATSSASPPLSTKADATSKRRGKVLVVDDEPTLAKAIQRTLAAEHDVSIVGSAVDALARLVAGEQFDVILCDLMMPQMTGMELFARVSSIAHEQSTRMIFLTGGAFTSEARGFLETIANTRIEKPFDSARLRTLINDRVASIAAAP